MSANCKFEKIADTAARNTTSLIIRTNVLTPRVQAAVIIIRLTHLIAKFYLNQIQKFYNARDNPLHKSLMKALQNKNET